MSALSNDVQLMGYNRRTLVGGLLTVFSCSCCGVSANAQQQNKGGCWVSGNVAHTYLSRATRPNTYRSGNERMEPRSGQPQLDRALAQSLAKISSLFGVLPAFTYYDDTGSPNARATDETMLNRTDGTVLFGLQFLSQLLANSPQPNAAIVAVCAHEFGHILSYKNRMIAQLNPNPNQPFRGEQFADFMAGYYAGHRKLQVPDYPAVAFATTQRSFGGGDHGSGQQRGEAVEAGFLAAHSQKLNLNDAANAALNFCLARSL